MDSPNSQIIYSWKAPLRAYKKRGKLIMRFYFAVALLISLVILFIGDRILLVPILTLLFLFYVLTVTPPPEVEHIITTFGMETAGINLRWEFLSHYYFTKKFGFEVLTLVSHAPYYYHVYLIIPDTEIKGRVVEILSKHLMFIKQPHRSFTDKMVDLLSNLIPDDEEEQPEIKSGVSSVLQRLKASSL